MARLTIWSSSSITAPAWALFDPKFYILLQGAKRMTIGGATHVLGPGACAVATVGLPFTSQVVEADGEKPYVGVEIALNAGMIGALPHDGDGAAVAKDGSVSVSEADGSIIGPFGRLLRLLDDPSDIPTLAPLYERELWYRLLQGSLGSRLRQIARCDPRFVQVRTAADWIVENADRPWSIEWLATHVGMSVTSFHRHFKALTGETPLGYRRHVRLLQARSRLASGDRSVTMTAYDVGYGSASQFSREYKRAFGNSPANDLAL